MLIIARLWIVLLDNQFFHLKVLTFLIKYEAQNTVPLKSYHVLFLRSALEVPILHIRRYRIYLNKHRGAYLIFRATSAALI